MTSRRLKDAKGQEGSLGLPLSQKQPYDYSRKDGSLGPVHREKRLFEPPGSFEPTLLLRMQRGGGPLLSSPVSPMMMYCRSRRKQQGARGV